MESVMRCGVGDYEALAALWERSVRATHFFLSENDIAEIRRALIPVYFPNVELYGIRHKDVWAAFVGIVGEGIEMLFVDADLRGCGYGSLLIEFAIGRGCRRVDVNQQNPEALKFYLSKGFHVTGRDETDDCGRPFPILHLSL